MNPCNILSAYCARAGSLTLVERGVHEGDTVNIYDIEFDYVP